MRRSDTDSLLIGVNILFVLFENKSVVLTSWLDPAEWGRTRPQIWGWVGGEEG